MDGSGTRSRLPLDLPAGPRRRLLLMGDCEELLHEVADCSVDSLITDPPAGISFMGKDWDGAKGGRDAWVTWMAGVMAECLRVLKPGAHGLVWALPRTSHWTALALEDAGFEIRDSIHHVFGTGFPKSHDVSKAIDALAGVERERQAVQARATPSESIHQSGYGNPAWSPQVDEPVTDEARRWHGWGSALKPAHEVWWLVRKPLEESSIARQVLATGTGGINVEACRVGDSGGLHAVTYRRGGIFPNISGRDAVPCGGRFPPNLLFSHSADCTEEQCAEDCPVAELARQGGPQRSGDMRILRCSGRSGYDGGWTGGQEAVIVGSKGSVDRFFPCFWYTAKPSTVERNAGLQALSEEARVYNGQSDQPAGRSPGSVEDKFTGAPSRNTHPTVKSVDLMRWLVRLVTPPDGLVLDPFMGSGSTGCAAMCEGFRFIGFEREARHFEEACARIRWYAMHGADAVSAAKIEEKRDPAQGRLFNA